ncbi:MBL fold metallo-hydrolase [Wukongibacter sp. M2B1]|uniref:MBL fold metallo-hydrolase n=1 Tax=Wukongibacter sp. M2B1 TaxID=3088895 RepID=UPI003D7A4566
MKITILGNSGPYPRAGSACSGYLLETKNHKILIDCGNGTLSRLLSIIGSLNELDAIILSHLHSDHISDIMVMRYALGINQEKGTITKSIPLYAPRDPEDTYVKLQFKNAFIQEELMEHSILTFGDIRITFKLMSHPVRTYGLTVEENGKKFVYSSDTKYCDAVNEIAENSDLFLCECNLLERDRIEDAYHLSAKQVGEIATNARVKKLLLTHIWPEYDIDELLNETRNHFSGDVEIAAELESYEI